MVFNNTDEEIGGIQFLYKYPSLYAPYIILTTIGTVIGTFGNLLIILAVVFTKDLQTITNALIVNLAVSDFLIAAVSNSFSTVGVLVGKIYFESHPGLCSFIATSCFSTSLASLGSMAFIAFNRYVLICKNQMYKKIFSLKMTVFYIIMTWLLGLTITGISASVVGWTFFKYDEKVLSCHWNRLNDQTYNKVMVIVGIILPCVLILIFYVSIFLYARKSRSRTGSQADSLSFSLRIAKGLFGSYVLFSICWLPYASGIFFDTKDEWSREYYVYSMTVMILNSSMNPIFYGLTNPKFQKGYWNIYNIILCRKSAPLSAAKNKSSKSRSQKLSNTN